MYPYLLGGMNITKANQVWAADITYIPMARDSATWWPSWTGQAVKYCHGVYPLSNTQDAGLCVDALEEAIAWFVTPEIFNTDQGSQFTSDLFIQALSRRDIKLSMDGKGR